jgi:hypothetical protein
MKRDDLSHFKASPSTAEAFPSATHGIVHFRQELKIWEALNVDQRRSPVHFAIPKAPPVRRAGLFHALLAWR